MRGLGFITTVLAAAVCACAPEAEYETEIDEDGPRSEAVTPGTETGETAGDLAEYDADADDRLSREEFGAWATQRRSGAGAEGQGGMDRDAFSRSVVRTWDENDDDVVGEDEWRTGVSTLYGDDDYGVWADWDMDGDSELDANEVAEVLESRNLYDRVDLDRDALIDDEELADWFFDLFDVNDDEVVDSTEWDSAAAGGWYDSW